MASPNDPQPLVTSYPEVLGGAVVFVGTRVPLTTLIEYLEGGESVDSFLEDFPSVRRELAVGVISLLRELSAGTDPRASAA